MSNKNKKSELADFFSALSEEKEATRKKEQAARQKIKEKIEDPNNELSSLFAQLSNTLEESKKSSVVQQKKVDSISELMTSFVEEGPPKIVTEIKSEPVVEIEPEPVIELEPDPVVEIEPEPVVETISVPEIEEHSIVSNTVETIKKASPSEVKEQIDPFLELKIEFDKFKTHVQNHISKQGFAGAGSGEVRLEFLDDVQSSTAKVDGKFLKYSSSAGKWIGANVSGSGSSAIADLDIDGGTDIGAALADADLFIVDDGAGGTNRKTAASRIKTYVADVTLTTAAQTNITSVGTLTALTVDNVVINGTTIGHTDDTDLMTVADGVLTVAGELDAATLDISGNADIDGTLEADAITVDGIALDEFIADTVGAMVTSNTESGISVEYQDADNTLDFTIGTLNQDTTGNAATATALETARTIGGVSFDGTANINLPGVNTSGNQDTSGNAATATALETARTIGGVSFDGTANINLPGVNTSGTQDTSGTAAKVTVTDSNANTNFPIVFHDESNALLDDTGQLRYNPSTGTLLAPNLVVAGTTTQVNTVTMEAQNAVVFEGVTANDFETTLTITDPTADRTITMPDATGTMALTSSDITGNAATATALETARTIGGVSFDGSANINLPGVNTSGNQDTTGNAATSSKLEIAIILNGTDGSSSNAGDNLVLDTAADENDSILYEDATSDPIAVLASHGITLSGMGWNAFQFDNVESETEHGLDKLLEETNGDKMQFESGHNIALEDAA